VRSSIPCTATYTGRFVIVVNTGPTDSKNASANSRRRSGGADEPPGAAAPAL
jgi:hypothetical protein